MAQPKDDLVPDYAARGKPPNSYMYPVIKPPGSNYYLGMTAFRRRTSCQETCPPGAGMAKLYPNENGHWFYQYT